MAKGKQKVQPKNDIVDDCDSDSDDEYASPTYDELADLLKEYTQIIRKSKAKCDKLKDENEFLTAKYDIVVKASEEMKEENKTMSSTKNELKTSLKDAKEKCEKLSEANRELKDSLVKIKEDYIKIKIDYDNLLIVNELLSCNTHETINVVVKIDVATSCDDLSKVDQCWGLVLKCYELRTRQHKMLNINALHPPKHYLHKDLMNFGRRS
jgi:chromosome segregation ATPase